MRSHEFIQESLAANIIKGAASLAKSAVPAVTKAVPTLAKTAPAVGQQFLFNLQKPTIVSSIAQALKSGQAVDLKDPIYRVLRQGSTVADIGKLNYTAAEKAAYKSALDAWPKNNGAWAQKDFGPVKTVGQGMSQGGRTENYYATITKDRSNLDKFMKSFPDLDSRLAKLSQQTGQPISYKTNANISALVGDNDNLKLFYYDPKLKPQIEATVQSWLQANGIQTGVRTHTHGVDVAGKSFGQSIANHVNDSVNNLIKQHGAKYTPEQYYQWLGNNFKTLIGQVTVK